MSINIILLNTYCVIKEQINDGPVLEHISTDKYEHTKLYNILLNNKDSVINAGNTYKLKYYINDELVDSYDSTKVDNNRTNTNQLS